MPVITPCPRMGEGEYRTGTLHGLSYLQVFARLGFPPNRNELDDTAKVNASWGFLVDGEFCAVWSYHHSDQLLVFSTFGPSDRLRAVFGQYYRGDK